MEKVENVMTDLLKELTDAAVWLTDGIVALTKKLLAAVGKWTVKAGKCTLRVAGRKIRSFVAEHCQTLLIVEITAAALALVGGIIGLILTKRH